MAFHQRFSTSLLFSKPRRNEAVIIVDDYQVFHYFKQKPDAAEDGLLMKSVAMNLQMPAALVSLQPAHKGVEMTPYPLSPPVM